MVTKPGDQLRDVIFIAFRCVRAGLETVACTHRFARLLMITGPGCGGEYHWFTLVQ